MLSSLATVKIEMDVPLGSPDPSLPPPPLTLSGTLLVLVVVVAIIVSGVLLFLTVFYSRRRCRSYEGEKACVGRRVNGSLPPSPPVYESTFDQHPPLPPRCYETSSLRRPPGPRLGHGPASSGRGSDSVADEELRMITRVGPPQERLHSPVPSSLSSASKFLAPGVTIPDSGLQMAYSDLDDPPTASNHVEYLAQLGVGSCNGTSGLGSLLGEGCGGGTILSSLGMTPEEISLRELERREEPMMKSPPTVSRMVSALTPQQATFDDTNFRLDHLLNWTPSYQPLAQVFSEIARLKDEPSTPGFTGNGQTMRAHNGPPLFTDLPPQVLQPTLQPSLAPLTEHEVQI